jgi:hypothetical protein
MGRAKQEWQDRDYVLSWFGEKEGPARRAYRQYVKSGITEGRRPDLVGGGLIRSVGGWSEVMSLRRAKERVFTDERILGRGDFVETILREADERLKYQFGRNKGQKEVAAFIDQMCQQEQINVKELRMGSRRGRISEVRSEIAYQLVEHYGLPLAEIARHLGVSTSAISKAITRRTKE